MIAARVFDLLETVGADLRRDAFPELLPASGAEVLPEETPVGEEERLQADRVAWWERDGRHGHAGTGGVCDLRDGAAGLAVGQARVRGATVQVSPPIDSSFTHSAI